MKKIRTGDLPDDIYDQFQSLLEFTSKGFEKIIEDSQCTDCQLFINAVLHNIGCFAGTYIHYNISNKELQKENAQGLVDAFQSTLLFSIKDHDEKTPGI